jgi:hypothetical protein
MIRADKVSDGPVGKGTVFRSDGELAHEAGSMEEGLIRSPGRWMYGRAFQLDAETFPSPLPSATSDKQLT